MLFKLSVSHKILCWNYCKGLFTYHVSQKWGGLDPPFPPCQPKIRNGLTPPPPLVRKNQKTANSPSPLVTNHILPHSN